MRKLTNAEQELICFLLKDNPDTKQIINDIPNMIVEEMNDGGMGSLRFINENGLERRFGKQISEVTLLDEDNIPVSFAIFLDNRGDIFEMNVFKADLSKLIKVPTPPYIPLT